MKRLAAQCAWEREEVERVGKINMRLAEELEKARAALKEQEREVDKLRTWGGILYRALEGLQWPKGGWTSQTALDAAEQAARGALLLVPKSALTPPPQTKCPSCGTKAGIPCPTFCKKPRAAKGER